MLQVVQSAHCRVSSIVFALRGFCLLLLLGSSRKMRVNWHSESFSPITKSSALRVYKLYVGGTQGCFVVLSSTVGDAQGSKQLQRRPKKTLRRNIQWRLMRIFKRFEAPFHCCGQPLDGEASSAIETVVRVSCSMAIRSQSKNLR